MNETQVLLTNARVIDCTGAPPRSGQAVLLRGKRIAAVGAEAAVRRDLPPETPVIDLAGKTLLPGFIDCHVHIMWNPDPTAPPQRMSSVPVRGLGYWNSRGLLYALTACRLTLEAGFTTIQDMMAPNDQIFALRDALAAGEFSGPRLLASGMCITHTGGHGTEMLNGQDVAYIADGPDEVFKAVRQQLNAGADLIKIMGGTRPALSAPYRGRPGYTVEEMQPAIEEAHRAGVRVAAHAHSDTQGIKNCIQAGVDSVEHGFPLDEEGATWMIERGTFLVPTLSVNPAALEAIARGIWTYKGSEAHVQRMADMAPKTIELAHRLGVQIAFGTDAAMPLVMHGGNAREFELLVDYGLTPMEALLTATRNAAQNLHLDDQLGTIEAGKIADLVVVDGDPLADIRLLQNLDRIKLVFKDGQAVVSRL
ncbi:MAG: amidohydrolase family protein [Chloroflexi bacterium]|nr:amidohydrolase family protein [Chloroflexota bacterium]